MLRSYAGMTAVVVLLGLASSQVAPGRATAAPAVGAARGSAAGITTKVTLITGDTVAYTEFPDGRNAVTLMQSRDGRTSGTYHGSRTATGTYLVPVEAEPYLTSGALDPELFNVSLLAHSGLDDRRADAVPVIVEYGAQTGTNALAPRAKALPSASVRRTLESVHGVGVAVRKAGARSFWTSIVPGADPAPATRAFANGVNRVWLDRPIGIDLAESVPFIGASEAWQAGFDGTGVKVAVLDTGIDDTHPDFAGHIAEERNFTPAASAKDGNGHGTHVASTILGSGAASNGKYKGVAPGARLVVGKVLGDDGRGSESDIIDGMEWAAASGARVVSMSLGSQFGTDGTDPMAQAVNSLTDSTGTLFVIAAGNIGPGAGTIGSPGSADSALTVGAVDKAGLLANFSSRGPRLNNDAVKPEITAPGVAIVAARAAGTTLGTPVGQSYTTLSGTSMATPHVSGAAAILAQQHPTWTAAQLKAALVASAKDGGYTVFEQGAGRVDVAREIHQEVIAEPATVSFGQVSPDPGTPPVVKQVTFRNLGAADHTYNLKLTGADAAAGGTLRPGTLTVPAGGTATVEVTANPTALALGPHSWRIEATEAAGGQVVVPVGLVREPLRHKVTVRLTNTLPGSTSFGGVTRVDDEKQTFLATIDLKRTADPTVRQGEVIVPEGTHHIAVYVEGTSANGRRLIAGLVLPEVTVTGDVTLTIDQAKAVPIRLDTPVPTEETSRTLAFTRTTRSGITYSDWMLNNEGAFTDLRVLPTAQPTIGAFKLSHDHVLTAPQATLRLDGNGSTELRPAYLTYEPWIPKFGTDQRLAVATADDLRSGRDVRGKLVFVEFAPAQDYRPDLDRAIAAGAAGVLATSNFVPTELTLPQFKADMAIPLLWLDQDQAAAVRRQLAGRHRVTATVRAQVTSPFEYKLRYYQLDRVPDRLTLQVRQRDLATVQTAYHGEFAGLPDFAEVDESSHTFRPEDPTSFMQGHDFDAPVRRVEYYLPTGPEVMWWRQYAFEGDDRTVANTIEYTDSMRGFTSATHESEDWNEPVLVPGQIRPGPEFPRSRPTTWEFMCQFCRQSDRVYPAPRITGDGDPSHNVLTPNTPQSVFETHLFTGDREVAPSVDDLGSYWPVGRSSARYRLTLTTRDDFAGKQLAKSTTTTWSFTSSAPKSNTVSQPYTCPSAVLTGNTDPCGWLPLIYPQYELPLALDNTAPAGRPFGFTITAMTAAPSGAPPIAGARVWVSYDDGAHWTAAQVSGAHGRFHVLVAHPARQRTSGAVSIRAELWDSAGNRVEQVINRAYGLSGPTGRGTFE